MEHSGKTAFITGGGKNIGRAIAINLASTGCNIVLNGNSDTEACEETAQVLVEKGVKASIVMGNVGSADEVKRMASEALDQFGRIDILVNNAAIRPSKPFLEMDLEFFQELWDVCAKGAFLVSQEAIPRLVVGGGSLIFTGATASIRSKPPFTAFAAAKSAERSLAQGLAREFGPQGVHVAHVIVDGIIDGDKVNLRFPDFANSKGEDGKLNIDSIAENFLMLHKQKKSTWSFEIDLRPWSETW